jgi:hypothetical protein
MVIPLFAHMGGIDEIGIFVIPALLAIYVLRRTEREARKRAAAEKPEDAESTEIAEGDSHALPPGGRPDSAP